MIKLEEGKYYRTADGRKVGPIRKVQGTFVVLVDDPNPYYRTVTTDPYALPSRLFVAEWTDEPKLWRDMTSEEKGALLLAHHEGEVIEKWTAVVGYSDWMEHLPPFTKQPFRDDRAYRIRPEPERKTVKFYGSVDLDADGDPYFSFYLRSEHTHLIAFDTIDGEPDTSSIKMEKL